ncbi:MAG: hypothetical protein QY323_03910 [Patescibacteria group bacterium]|nr:MAG: hypothetical protein QY323_03910 [Patescibacteria group bacterium]
MSIWDKIGLGKQKNESQNPAPAKQDQKERIPDAFRVLVPGKGSLKSETASEKEGRISKHVERYLKDVVPDAKAGQEKISNALRDFSTPAAQEDYLRRYTNMAIVPGYQKPSFQEWVANERENLIKGLSNAEDYRVVTQHMDEAFREAGKNPEQAIALLEQKAAIINTEVAGLERQGGSADRVNQLRLKAKRLYAAVNKLDELIQNK